jgi:hypothetical protein
MTISTASEYTGIDISTFRKAGLTANSTQNEVVQFLQKRTEPRGAFSQEKAAKVVELLNTIENAETETPSEGKEMQVKAETKKETTPAMPRKKRETPIAKIVTETELQTETQSQTKSGNAFISFLLSDHFLSMVFTIGFFAQTLHTVRFAKTCMTGSNEAEGWLFAIAIDLTAFTLSIRTKKDIFLIGSLIAHTAINLTYYYSTSEIGIANGLLSVLMALAVFSYSELITQTTITQKR